MNLLRILFPWSARGADRTATGLASKPVEPEAAAHDEVKAPPGGVYCRLAAIRGHEKERDYCDAILAREAGEQRSIVIIKVHDMIYAQGNFPLLEDDEEYNFKAIWPLWWYIYEQFFTLITELREVEKFLFVDEGLFQEFVNTSEFIDIVDLFLLVER